MGLFGRQITKTNFVRSFLFSTRVDRKEIFGSLVLLSIHDGSQMLTVLVAALFCELHYFDINRIFSSLKNRLPTTTRVVAVE